MSHSAIVPENSASRVRLFRLPRRRVTLLAGLVLIIGAVVMIAWVVQLAETLRGSARVHNWSSTWVGLDIAEMVAMVAIGTALIRRSPYTDVLAGMGAVLFAIDAWFDVLTSAGSQSHAQAILLACAAEIPMALILGTIAWRSRVWFGHGRPAGHDRPAELAPTGSGSADSPSNAVESALQDLAA